MRIFAMGLAVIVGASVSGAAGAIGVAVGFMIANAYHVFD